MKKLTAVLLGCILAFNFAAFAEVKEADQKWLEAVEKMVTKGEKKITTPNEDRVNLLKAWGDKKGYAVKVTKTEKSYSLEVTPKEAPKAVAQK
ncbi:MAG TPA: hypothetical protein VJA21_29100 [Verrucomicrobiae bacterium]